MRAEGLPTVDPARLTLPAGSAWNRLPMVGAVVGILAIAASFALGGGEDAAQLYFSWLVAFLFFLSIALGGLFFVLVHFVTKAGWGVVVRRLAENAMATLPLFALLFVPVALGIHDLFHWSHDDAVAHDALLAAKAPYLNDGFFLARAAGYFLVWIGIALVYQRASRRQDATGDERITRRLTAASGPCIIAFAVTVSFAAIDWIMSLDPHWYSTIFGVYYFAGSLIAIFAFTILVAVGLSRRGALHGVVTTEHFHDLGKLLFAFTVFWAYIAFSQYFLIWYANIPEETVWYMHRTEGGWFSVALLLAVGHFAVPFFFLMPRSVKRRTLPLAVGALWMLAMHFVDLYWLVMPVLHHDGPQFGWLDLTTFLGCGALFLAAFAWPLGRAPVVPVRDPRLGESMGFENF